MSVPARSTEQEIRFAAVDGHRFAYATVGSGPPLLLPALWIGHLELECGIAPPRGASRPETRRAPRAAAG